MRFPLVFPSEQVNNIIKFIDCRECRKIQDPSDRTGLFGRLFLHTNSESITQAKAILLFSLRKVHEFLET